MSARNFIQTLGAGETIRLPRGRFFFVRTAASALDIATEGNPGAPVTFAGIGAGSKFGPVAEDQGWKFLRITSAAAQNIEIIISDDGNFDVANTVTVSGSVNVLSTPAATIATPARATRATGGADTIAANLSRRRITICNPSDNASPGLLYVQAVGTGAGRGYPLDTGTSVQIETTAALDVRNDSGVSVDYTVFEES